MSIVVLAFTDFADNQSGRPHPALLTARWLQGVIIAGYFALKFAEDYYAKQVGNRRTQLASPDRVSGGCLSGGRSRGLGR